ncbi:MAG: hypothetical protein H6523_01950 [Mycolicibacterium sp.]|nr:hypothetical protein [Mycolicibacterium insubricum]MCB9439007.1 hypothetical protein [Mycolicibacterium sp.]
MMDTGTRGPLPPEIYRRRRALALGVGALVLVVIVVIAVVVARSGSSNDGNTNAATDTTAEATAPEVKSPVVPPAVNSPAPTPTQTKAVEPPPVLKAGDDCPDSTLAVKGITNQPRYNVGDQPKFTMVVTNIGVVGCKRDVGASVLAAYVYSLDNKRLWSNLDCAPSNETLVKTIEPGAQVTTEVTWTGMGSEPQCPMPRQPIGAGTYNLVIQLGNLKSAPVPFVLNEAGAGEPPAEPAPAEPAPAETHAPGPAPGN